jgi:hypothetical protein
MKHFAAGLGGFVAGVVAVASCDHTGIADSATDSARQVSYANSRSGLKSTTVQDAIDEIGTTARAATATTKVALNDGGLIRAAFGDEGSNGVTTWSVKVTQGVLHDKGTTCKNGGGGSGGSGSGGAGGAGASGPCPPATFETSDLGTVTFTETAPGQGKYSVSEANMLLTAGFLNTPKDVYELNGVYSFAGNKRLLVAGYYPMSAKPNNGEWQVEISDGGNTVTLSLVAGVGAYLVLTKQ